MLEKRIHVHALFRCLSLCVVLALALAACDGDEPPGSNVDASPGSFCCDPAEEPGVGDNPLCFEGASCCADGSWQCNNFGGPDTCDDFGGVCVATLCDPATEPGENGNPTCVEGHTCCPDGQWSCNQATGEPVCPE